MEVDIISTATKESPEDTDADIPLPGFRFNPTDEELVGFYLRRKVERKPLYPEIIKQADIYKHDPWDLLSGNKGIGEREWYFFCKRGRKYRNSVRPNRVTGSGFWKATGIDRPVNSSSGGHIIGLKKSLVYYLGSAGKGTKTEWMMHEFRLPPPSAATTNLAADEAEVWTLCRLWMRTVSKRLPEWKSPRNSSKVSVISESKIVPQFDLCFSETGSIGSSVVQSKYISFSEQSVPQNENKKPHNNQPPQQLGLWGPMLQSTLILSSCVDGDFDELLKYADWDDLNSIVNYGNPV